MTGDSFREISVGTILEFFEAKQVVCAACTAVKNHRLTVLTEQDRELNLARRLVESQRSE